jgi:hypothetical protein
MIRSDKSELHNQIQNRHGNDREDACFVLHTNILTQLHIPQSSKEMLVAEINKTK